MVSPLRAVLADSVALSFASAPPATAMGRLAAEGRLRAGVTVDEATDVAWAVASPHQYEYLVIAKGWDLARYRAHLERAIGSLLLGGGPEEEVQPRI